MSENLQNKPSDHLNEEVQEGLIEFAKKIKSGELGSDQLSKVMTKEVAKELVALIQDVELGKISNEDLVKYLAMILKRLSRGKVKTLKKRKKKSKSVLDILMEQMLRTFVKSKVASKQNNQDNKPGKLAKALIQDLDRAIFKLTNDTRLDSDLNDIQLIEDMIAVNQKVAALTSNVSRSIKGMSMKLINAMTATGSIGGTKGLATLSTLKSEVAMESWNNASSINYDAVSGRVEPTSTKEEIDLEKSMKHKLMARSEEAQLPSGPDDVPTTEAVKKFKEEKNLEWQQSRTVPDHS